MGIIQEINIQDIKVFKFVEILFLSKKYSELRNLISFFDIIAGQLCHLLPNILYLINNCNTSSGKCM